MVGKRNPGALAGAAGVGMTFKASELNVVEPICPFPGVDPEMYQRVCREHRSPPLTPAEKRRADAISFDDTPRERLAAAWAGASEQDRRDLIERASGRTAA